MKYALQLFGQFRSFEECLPTVLKYIDYYKRDFDVYILTEKSGNYSPENEAKIKDMLGEDRIKLFTYVEDYPEIKIFEEQSVKSYIALVKSYINKFKFITDEYGDFHSHKFGINMWYRRYFLNNLRKSFNIKYDWIIRTRFDIKLVKNEMGDFLNYPPIPDTVRISPDIFTAGSPKDIDIESELGKVFPIAPKLVKYDEEKKDFIYPFYADHYGMPWIVEWMFMSEENLTMFLRYHGVKIIHCSAFKITR